MRRAAAASNVDVAAVVEVDRASHRLTTAIWNSYQKRTTSTLTK